MSDDNGIHTKHRGQHRAGKHTAKAQKLAKENPRLRKVTAFREEDDQPGPKVSGAGVYHSENSEKTGLLGRMFGKK